MEASSVTNLLFQQLGFKAEQQKVISSNIANIDTPGYKTKELTFSDEFKKAQKDTMPQLNLVVTNKNHIQVENSNKRTNPYTITEVKGLDEQNDGNNVNIDTQMSKMAQNSVMFQAIQSSIKKDSTWFKSVVDASAKN